MANSINARQKTAPWFPSKKEVVLVGGAGGIGSWVALLLARATFIPYVVDFDTIDEHNLGGQFFPVNSIGRKKVDSLREIIKTMTGNFIHTEDTRIMENGENPIHKYTIVCFDNMLARRILFEQWCKHVDMYSLEDAIFIDGSLLAEQLTIYCVTPDRREQYRSQLVDDNQLPDERCTFQQTSYSAAMIASHIVGFFLNHFTNVVTEDDERQLPFKWEYFVPLNLITES